MENKDISLMDKKILLIGAGTMGRAIANGLISTGEVDSIVALEKSIKFAEKINSETSDKIQVLSVAQGEEHIKEADIIILCVKPQDIGVSIELIKPYLKPDTLIVSIAAGVSTGYIEMVLETENPVIRVMPNTPCLIKEGMMVFSRGTNADPDHTALAMKLFSALGECIEVEEKNMNAVTGLSGSGPAYIYLIIEALADGGVMEGLPRKVATKLAAQTLLGAAKMVLETGKHPAELKDDVTTPAGCTIGALLNLEDGKIRSVLARSVQEATRIASRLGD